MFPFQQMFFSTRETSSCILYYPEQTGSGCAFVHFKVEMNEIEKHVGVRFHPDLDLSGEGRLCVAVSKTTKFFKNSSGIFPPPGI